MISKKSLLKKKTKLKNEYFTPVVLMAGGKGIRLRPFTNFFPKFCSPINS